MSPLQTMTTDEILAWFTACVNEWIPQKRAELQAQRDRLAKRAKPDAQKKGSPGVPFMEIAFAGQERDDEDASAAQSVPSDEAVHSEAAITDDDLQTDTENLAPLAAAQDEQKTEGAESEQQSIHPSDDIPGESLFEDNAFPLSPAPAVSPPSLPGEEEDLT